MNSYNITLYIFVIVIPICVICCCIQLLKRYLCDREADKRRTQQTILIQGQNGQPSVFVSQNSGNFNQPDLVPGYPQSPPDYAEVSALPPSYEEVMRSTNNTHHVQVDIERQQGT